MVSCVFGTNGPANGQSNKGGTLAINAVHMSPIPEIKYDLIYNERTVRSVANLTRTDATEFLKLAGDIPIHTDVKTYNLNEANKVLQKLKKASTPTISTSDC